ncbi:chitinase 18-4 [Cordyceps militaris]|uniref:chitinase n=1 Tax=Cordyceps militaris TaxID=73501 RepID=A0A2H4S7K4_CORMI|nr:chitinase 18-4 [Cordyceps militaris]
MFGKSTAQLWLMCFQALAMASAPRDSPRCIMYLTGQHDVIPESADLRNGITHVILAFMRSETFNMEPGQVEFPLFTSVNEVRQRFPSTTKVLVAIGGWGDSVGFEEAAKDATSRSLWSSNVKQMIETTGADGIDIDWEYPGGNRDDYKSIPNSQREWEVDAYPLLLRQLRVTLGNDIILSIAVPGLERDLMAFTSDTVPIIVEQVDFINIMTYDLINRRDTVVKHHSGIADSRAAVQRYLDRGVPRAKTNLGLGYYVKWVMTEDCKKGDDILRCPTQLLEDPETGDDLGRIAAFSWHDTVPDELGESFSRALDDGKYFEDGSYGYWDEHERRWWTFDPPRVIERKMKDLVGSMGLGGVFAWGLGEDASDFTRLAATVQGVRALLSSDGGKDEL